MNDNGNPVFTSVEEGRDACLAHDPECICVMHPGTLTKGAHYFILAPGETYGSEWEVLGHGVSELHAWDNAFALCFA